MPGANLAHKLGVTRARVAQAESTDAGGNTLKSLHIFAEAMGCRFVYAILPPVGLKMEDMTFAQATKRARVLAERTVEHVPLEGQSLFKATLDDQIKWLAQKLAIEMATDLWIDK